MLNQSLCKEHDTWKLEDARHAQTRLDLGRNERAAGFASKNDHIAKLLRPNKDLDLNRISSFVLSFLLGQFDYYRGDTLALPGLLRKGMWDNPTIAGYIDEAVSSDHPAQLDVRLSDDVWGCVTLQQQVIYHCLTWRLGPVVRKLLVGISFTLV